MDNGNANTEAKPFPIRAVILGVIALWLGAAALAYHVFADWSERGTFGDTFGSINALFSGLAFAILIYAIHLQRTELNLQRKELELTREELARTARAQEASHEALQKQAGLLELTAKLNAHAACANVLNQRVAIAVQRGEPDDTIRGQLEFWKVSYTLLEATMKSASIDVPKT